MTTALYCSYSKGIQAIRREQVYFGPANFTQTGRPITVTLIQNVDGSTRRVMDALMRRSSTLPFREALSLLWRLFQ